MALIADHAVERGSEVGAEPAGLVRSSLTCRGRASRLLLELAQFSDGGVDARGMRGADAIGGRGVYATGGTWLVRDRRGHDVVGVGHILIHVGFGGSKIKGHGVGLLPRGLPGAVRRRAILVDLGGGTRGPGIV